MEESQDKDDKIEELQANVEIHVNAKNFLKKSYDSLMAKLKRIEEENFLIPKKKEADGGPANKPKEGGGEEEKGGQDNELNTILQNELRQLHFKLRQKDQIITEFKKEAQAYYA